MKTKILVLGLLAASSLALSQITLADDLIIQTYPTAKPVEKTTGAEVMHPNAAVKDAQHQQEKNMQQ